MGLPDYAPMVDSVDELAIYHWCAETEELSRVLQNILALFLVY